VVVGIGATSSLVCGTVGCRWYLTQLPNGHEWLKLGLCTSSYSPKIVGWGRRPYLVSKGQEQVGLMLVAMVTTDPEAEGC
jgi:hypothetical protein